MWCGFWAGGVIGSYFFDETDGERYRQMLKEFVWPEIDRLDLGHMWFQQDGATCHTSLETRELIRLKFGERVISKKEEVEWPPRSCDLTPLDFFLWGFLKSKVYANRPATIEQLKINIRCWILFEFFRQTKDPASAARCL